MGKITLNELRNRASTVDREKLDGVAIEAVRERKASEGYGDLKVPVNARRVAAPRELRVRLALTQQEMADALRIPVGTWRNWEQGRVALDPAARSLLDIVDREPKMALAALKVE